MSDQLRAISSRLTKLADMHHWHRKEPLAKGNRRYYGHLAPLNFKNASAGYYRGFDDIADVADNLFSLVTTTPGLLYQINTLGGAINDLDDGTRTAYAHRQANYLGEIQSYWDDPADEARLTAAVAQFGQRLRAGGIDEHYANYPDIAFADWQAAYYGKQGYERLRKVKQAHDPNDLFRHPQSVRP